MGVDVTHRIGTDVRLVQRQAHAAGRLTAIGARCRHVMGIVGVAETADLRIYRCASRHCTTPFFQHKHRRALAHHETVTRLIERPAGVPRIVVAGGHGADQRKGAEAERCEWRFRTAGQHHVGITPCDGTKGIPHGDGARGAAHAVGGIGTGGTELDGDVATGGAREDR